jgi:hypothetical protein
MSEKINQSIDYNNKYDNSDLVLEREARDLAAAYSKIEQMNAYKTYLETLKLEAELSTGNLKVPVYVKELVSGKMTVVAKQVPAQQLMERPSEFEQLRRLVLRQLNNADKVSDEKLKQLMADYEVDGIFELSSVIANFLTDHNRREKNKNDFKMKTLTDGL